MSLSTGTRRASGTVHTQADQTQAPSGQVILFIAAVLVAGMTCVLYLWQQSRIVAANQDITNLNAQMITREQQLADLQAQVNRLQAVTHVVAMANKLGMVQGNSLQFKTVTVNESGQPPVVASLSPNQQSTVVLPATNAAITYWWQDAWDGMFSLLQ